jgi:hypothetical protein
MDNCANIDNFGNLPNHLLAGIPELKCLVQIKMVKIPTSKHSNWFGGLSKTGDILIVVAAL